MFARWQYLIKRLPLLTTEPSGPEFPPLPEDMEDTPYCEAKSLCATYKIAKERLMEAFETAQLGRWIKKPIEQDHFTCEILRADPNELFI